MDDSVAMNVHAEGEAAGVTYKPVNKLAITSLLLGGLSFVAFASPVLWVVPVTAIVLGLIAWRSAAKGATVGRWPALSGLFLAAFFGSWAVTQNQISRSHAIATTREFAVKWVEILQAGDINQAFQFHESSESDAKKPSESYEEYYSTRPRQLENLNEIIAKSPIKELIAHPGKLHYLNSDIIELGASTSVVLHRFRFSYSVEDTAVVTNVNISVLGRTRGEATEWYVRDVNTE